MKASIFALSLLASAPVLSAQSQPTVQWLEPPDALIQKAVDDGFSQKKLSFVEWAKTLT
jgi:hypothetical protein